MMESTVPNVEPPERARQIGPFEVLHQLGAGGMGRVLRCLDTRLGREVAVKLPEADLRGDPALRQRFLREARLLAALQHPNVVSLFSLEEDASFGPYLVMECLEGVDLASDEGRERARADVHGTLAQIAAGLRAVHEVGLVHRDLKPANVMLGKGFLKLVDFGLAKRALPGEQRDQPSHADGDVTREGQLLGTLPYMSPEQLGGEAVDQRTDVWAFGCLAYELLTGVQPFRRPTATATMAAILSCAYDTAALGEQPSSLRHLISRCLEPSLDQRMRDLGEADEVLQGLRDASAPESVARTAAERRASLGAASRALAARALSDQRWSDAVAHYGDVAEQELGGRDLEDYAWACRWTGEYERALELLARAERLLLREGDPAAAARVAALQAFDQAQRLRHAAARGCLMRARRHLQGQPECEATGIVLWIGGLLAAAGDPSQAGASGEELLQLAGRVGSNDLRALGLALCGHSRLVAGDITEGIALHDEAAAMAVGGELGPLVTGYVLCTIIYGCRARADWHRASELSTCANDWCDRTSMGYFPGLCRTHRAEVVRFSGRLEEARSEAWAAADLLLAASPFAGGLAFSELAEIAFRLGEFEEADQWCRRALAVGRPPQPVLGRLMLVQGAAESAVAGLRGCLEGLFLEDAVHVLPVLVEAALAAGDEVEAERALGELEVLASKLGTPAPRAALESSRGRVMLARGDAAAAQEVLRAAHQSWSRVGAPFEAADALLGLARAQALCSDRVGARVSAETARDEFRRIGAKAREREADDLVDGLTPGS